MWKIVFTHVKRLSSATSPSCRHFLFHLSTSPSLSLSLFRASAQRDSLTRGKNLFRCAPLSLFSHFSLYMPFLLSISPSLSLMLHITFSPITLFFANLFPLVRASVSLYRVHTIKSLFIVSFLAVSPSLYCMLLGDSFSFKCALSISIFMLLSLFSLICLSKEER